MNALMVSILRGGDEQESGCYVVAGKVQVHLNTFRQLVLWCISHIWPEPVAGVRNESCATVLGIAAQQ